MRLKADKLTKSFNGHKVVQDISFTIKDGEIVGVVGPNGAGKSTTLSMVCGILPADSGKITINGISPEGNSCDFRRQFSFVPERPGLHQDVSCFDFLSFSASTNGKNIEDIIIAAKEAGCDNYLERPMDVLSRGQRQAVYLAAAFIAEPSLLILDEPTVGLDPIQQRSILDALRRFCNKGGSVLLSTHSLHEAETICERILVLMHNTIIADGKASDIAKKHNNLYEFLTDKMNTGHVS